MTDQERTRAAATESIFGALLLVAGVLSTTLGGFAGTIGLVLIVFGVMGVAHAVVLGLGLIGAPGEHKDRRREQHEDLRRRRRRR